MCVFHPGAGVGCGVQLSFNTFLSRRNDDITITLTLYTQLDIVIKYVFSVIASAKKTFIHQFIMNWMF